MRDHMTSVDGVEGPLLDIVGTGGDGAHTVNLSTTAAIVAASCGVRVAKHGNRSVSSKAGSADVLEVLGVKMLDPDKIVSCLEEAGGSVYVCTEISSRNETCGSRTQIFGCTYYF